MNWQAFWLTFRLASLVAVNWWILGSPHRLLDRLLALALEVPRRSGRRLADCAASYRTRLLCSGGARHPQSAGPLVGFPDWPYPGVYL